MTHSRHQSKPDQTANRGKRPTKGLGQYLVDAGKLNPANIERACRLQQEQDQWERIGTILIKLGLVSERDVAESLAHQLELPLADRKEFPDESPLDSEVSAGFMEENRILALKEENGELTVAMADPRDQYLIGALALSTGKTIKVRVGLASEIDLALQQQQQARKQCPVAHRAGSVDTLA